MEKFQFHFFRFKILEEFSATFSSLGGVWCREADRDHQQDL